MIEVEVHQQLRAFLREQGEPYWPHHLTMARLVARALRLERSSLIQAGAPSGYHGRYRLSYLMPLLIWQGAAVMVAPEAVQQRLLMVEIPRLKQWISTHKPIQTGDRWPDPDFQGLLITTPQRWLSDRLERQGHFPQGIPTVIDGVDSLEQWARDVLTVSIQSQDWDWLMLARPEQADLIRDVRVRLTRSVFQHPANPYECYVIEQELRDRLAQLWATVSGIATAHGSPPNGVDHALSDAGKPGTQVQRAASLPSNWVHFFANLLAEDTLLWVQVARQTGQFALRCGPIDVAEPLRHVWAEQPVVLIGGALDLDPKADIYRQRIGLSETATCVKFSPDRQHEIVQLYLPDRLPMPNTPQFQPALLQELRQLLTATRSLTGLTVVVVGDVPLKAQVGSVLAAEFGTRVQVEKTCLDDQGILVTGWEFWQRHQAVFPAPNLLVIATLPIPSLEHPLVAARVAYYKHQRQDWFRLYLLPEALSQLQRAIAPVRDAQGVVALLDNRVNYRSYGQQVLTALSPHARINYVDPNLFSSIDYFSVD